MSNNSLLQKEACGLSVRLRRAETAMTLRSFISVEGEICFRRTRVSISNALFASSYLGRLPASYIGARHFCLCVIWERFCLSACRCVSERGAGDSWAVQRGDKAERRKQSSGVCDKGSGGNQSARPQTRWRLRLFGKFYRASQTNCSRREQV